MSIKNVRVIKNYIDQKLLLDLNKWTLENYRKEFFNISGMNNCQTRFTTRQCTNRGVDHLFDYPNFVYNLQHKIESDFDISDQQKAMIGKNGVVTGIGFENDYIRKHKDPIWYRGTNTVHFNFITQKPLSGGVTVIDNQEYDINSGDILIYNVSEYYHLVTKVIGKIPRILYVFGYSLNQEKLKRVFT